MKKKIIIALGVYSLTFVLGGIYIITTIEDSTSTLNNLIRLHQVETQRERLLTHIKDVQSDLILRRTTHAKGIDKIIGNVKSMENLTEACFECHHSEYVTKGLNDLRNRVEKYKVLVSRMLTIRANRERLKEEDDKAFQAAEQLSTKIGEMVHLATSKLSRKTHSSLKYISNTKVVLYVLVSITPFFAAALGFLFIRGLTKPIKVLLKATRTLKDGNLDFRIEGLRDGFGEVAESFNEMGVRVQEYTQKLEGKTRQLERAHNEMSTFCHVLKQIGVQRTLDGVCSFLIKELQAIVNSQYMVLYVFSADHSILFSFSGKDLTTFSEPELIQTASNILGGLDRLTIAPEKPFEAPLIPDYFPVEARQSIIPLRPHNQVEGAFVVAYEPDFQVDEKALELVALVLDQAAGSIKRAVLHEEEIRYIQNRLDSTVEYNGIIGKDPKMQAIYKLIEDIAPTDATVLIQGGSGTGKELVARAIHQKSLRKNKPFIVINCSAYPTTLLEAELFGHEKGAFTGAVQRKSGRFEQADGGTVFLDEIGEIDPSAQVKLLRVLQTQKFERLGGEQTLEVDVRILAATNKNLQKEVENRRFREDLFYRLNVIPLHLPPLRKRKNDIPLLAKHFLHRFATEQGKDVQRLSAEVTRLFFDYSWSGNVRELENIIEHAVVLAKYKQIEVSDLPPALQSANSSVPAESNRSIFMENEKKLLEHVLEACGWNKKQAALRLGISRSTLYSKLSKHQIARPTIQ
jgi:two-component system response regulator HydG